MKIYQIEQHLVEQNNLWNELRQYIETEALSQQAHEVEENLFKKLLKIGKSMLSEVFTRFNAQMSETEIEQLPCHGTNSRKYYSIFGLIDITRAYFWKPGAKGIYPLDAHFNLPERRYSHLLVKWVQDGIAEQPYEEAIEHIQRIFGLNLCKRGQEELSQEVTKDVEPFYHDKTLGAFDIEGSTLVATADCKGVTMVPAERSEHVKTEAKVTPMARDGRGRKGLKRDAVVTADYSFIPEVRTPEEVLDLLMRSHTKQEREIKRKTQKRCEWEEKKPREPLNKQVMASLKGKTVAFRELADRIAKRDPSEKKSIYIQIDGAASLEKGLLHEFEKRGWKDRIIGVGLDIIHVMEYVWEASTSLHGEKSQRRVDWVRKQGLAILNGDVGRVIGGLKQIITKKGTTIRKTQKTVLEKVIGYFSNHQHMMRYDEYLAKGFPIATGVIKGACGSLVKDRTDRSGMKWTHNGVQAVLNLRALKRNGDWEAYWSNYFQKEHERLYGYVTQLAA